jgi:hypothetical protein
MSRAGKHGHRMVNTCCVSLWTNRTPAGGSKPSPHAGAGMVLDSARNSFVIFRQPDAAGSQGL